jgi:hypothetical protein
MGRTEVYEADPATGALAGVRNTVTGDQVCTSWVKCTGTVPTKVAVAMAGHESSFTLNEHDTEISGYESFGIFQLSRAEMYGPPALLPTGNVYDLDDSCKALACILEANLTVILRVASAAYANGLGKNPVDANGNPIDDVWAYVAVSHNIGLGSELNTNPGGKGVLPGIVAYGLSWPDAFQQAHPSMTAQATYGSDAISGGDSWSDAWASIQPDPSNPPSTGAATRMLVFIGILVLAVVGMAVFISSLGGKPLVQA